MTRYRDRDGDMDKVRLIWFERKSVKIENIGKP